MSRVSSVENCSSRIRISVRRFRALSVGSDSNGSRRVTRTRCRDNRDVVSTSISYKNTDGVSFSTRSFSCPSPSVICILISCFVILKILDEGCSTCVNSILQCAVGNTNCLKNTTIRKELRCSIPILVVIIVGFTIYLNKLALGRNVYDFFYRTQFKGSCDNTDIGGG